MTHDTDDMDDMSYGMSYTGHKKAPAIRDGKQGAGVESGTCHKQAIGNPDLGQGAMGYEGKSKANPSIPVARGHTIK